MPGSRYRRLVIGDDSNCCQSRPLSTVVCRYRRLIIGDDSCSSRPLNGCNSTVGTDGWSARGRCRMSIPMVGRGSARSRSRVSVLTGDGCLMGPTVIFFVKVTQSVTHLRVKPACRGRCRLSVPTVGRPEAVVECRSAGTDGW